MKKSRHTDILSSKVHLKLRMVDLVATSISRYFISLHVAQLKLEQWSLPMVAMESEAALEEQQVLLSWKNSLLLQNTL